MKVIRSKFTALALAAAGLFAATPAQADPITIVATLSAYIGTTAAVFVANAVILATAYGAYALAAYSIYSSIAARNAAKRQAAAARAAYNAGLTARNITALTSAPPWRVIYGRAETGGDVVGIFTTDKPNKPDALKHIVVVWSARQCQAINGLKIDGVPLGTLDSGGRATGSEWSKSRARLSQETVASGGVRSTILPSGSIVISVTLISGGESATYAPVPAGGGTYGYSLSGTTLTLPGTVTRAESDYTPGSSDQWAISYLADNFEGEYDSESGSGSGSTSTVRVYHHLGAPDQDADAYLVSLLPGQWTANHRLRGRCYSVITLDLERAQFQGGPPGITADISGALVLDPRTGTTAWSQNPALCAYDWLRFIGGLNVSAAEVDTASVIAAANVCDESVSFTVGGVTTSGPRYTCNGPIQVGAAKEAVLLDICESMAGWASYGGVWRLLPGSWVPTVMDLTDADLHGSIDIVQAGEPSGQLHNAVRGQYVPAGSAVPADLEPYQNATFVTADGEPLWKDLELPFTNSRPRARNIARISVEQSRNGLVIFFPAKLRAWPLQAGDRVRVTSAEYGFTLKTFRVIDWSFGLRSPVGLTLQEDDPAAYDEADASSPDPTPNTDLPNPWVVPPLASLTAASGTAQLQRLGDGTVISRVLVTWPRSTAAYMQGGRIELAWREAGKSVVTLVNADGGDTQAYLTGVRDGSVLVIDVTAINTQRARSPTISIGHLVLGKSVPPAAVTALAYAPQPGGALLKWDACPDADYFDSTLRLGATYATAVAQWTGAASAYAWPQPTAGTYTLWLEHRDSSGNVSPPVSLTVTLSASNTMRSLTVTGDNYNANGAGFSGRGVEFSSGYKTTAASRGHTLVVYNPATDLIEFGPVSYDTYLSGTAALVAQLAAVAANRIVALYTYDSSACDAALRAALRGMGGGLTATWVADRQSHVFIGSPGWLPGEGYEAKTTLANAGGVISQQAYYTSVALLKQGASGVDGTNGTNGMNGMNGTAGAPGANGQTTYLHLKYSNDGGGTFTASVGETPGAYLGTLTDFTLADSTNPADYSWALIKGADGTNGTPGTPGNDGLTSYLHIKWSNDGGSSFTASGGETPGAYIGTYTDFTLADSGSVGAYTWALVKGADGTNGTPGTPGSDGTPSYVHVKYSNDGGSSFTASVGETPGSYIGVRTDATLADSTNPADYSWALIKGADGSNGSNGSNGQDAIAATLNQPAFSLPADSTGLVSSYAGASTTMTVMRGATVDSINWTFSYSNGPGVSSSIAGATVTVTSFATAQDTGYVDVTAARSGYTSQTLRFALSKAKSARPASGPVSLAGYYGSYNGAISPTDASCYVEFRRDGSVWTGFSPSTNNQSGDWYLPNGTTVGDAYEIRFDQISATGLSAGVSGGTVGAWQALSSSRGLTLTTTENTNASRFRIFNYVIRLASTQATVCTGSFSLDANVEI